MTDFFILNTEISNSDQEWEMYSTFLAHNNEAQNGQKRYLGTKKFNIKDK